MPSTDSLAVRTSWRLELPDEDAIAATAANFAEGRRILAWFGLCLAGRTSDRIDELGFLDDGSERGPTWSTEVDSVARPWM